MIEKLNEINEKKIVSVDDPLFAKYGRVLPYSMSEQSSSYYATKDTSAKANYVVHDEALAKDPIIKVIQNEVYGQMDIQVGLVLGRNDALTGIEYHQGSEVNYAFSDCVLLLGEQNKLTEEGVHIDQLDAFYIPKGTMIELDSAVLHYTPVEVRGDGMGMMVILLKGTNTEIDYEPGSRLIKKNKWYMCHRLQIPKRNLGYPVGLLGNMFVLNKI